MARSERWTGMLGTILADSGTSGSIDYEHVHTRQVGECLDHELVSPHAVLLHAISVDRALFVAEKLLERFPISDQMLGEALAHNLVLVAGVGERAKETIAITSHDHPPL